MFATLSLSFLSVCAVCALLRIFTKILLLCFRIFFFSLRLFVHSVFFSTQCFLLLSLLFAFCIHRIFALVFFSLFQFFNMFLSCLVHNSYEINGLRSVFLSFSFPLSGLSRSITSWILLCIPNSIIDGRIANTHTHTREMANRSERKRHTTMKQSHTVLRA